MVAGHLNGPVTVTLHRPPPLDTPMTVDFDGGAVRVHDGDVLIAEAVAAAAPDLPVPDVVSAAEARAAQGRSPYFEAPVFPTCFVCGIDREAGDGLRVFPGPVPGRGVWAAPWTPDASVADGGFAAGGQMIRPEIAWAVLDCPGGITVGEAADLGDETGMLLGRMTATVTALPAVGDECQVLAWPVGRDGRKLTAGSALIGPGGRVLAVARSVWLTVPRSLLDGSALAKEAS